MLGRRSVLALSSARSEIMSQTCSFLRYRFAPQISPRVVIVNIWERVRYWCERSKSDRGALQAMRVENAERTDFVLGRTKRGVVLGIEEVERGTGSTTEVVGA